MNPYKAYSGVDERGHPSDGGGKSKGYKSPYKAYVGGVDEKSATHGSGKAGSNKPGGRKQRSSGGY